MPLHAMGTACCPLMEAQLFPNQCTLPITITLVECLLLGMQTWLSPSSSTLSISMSSTDNYTYFVNGRLVQQNHPRRSFFGTVGSSGSTLLTNSSSQAFVVTTLITSSASIDVYQDNTKLYDSRSYAAYFGMCNSPFKGNVAIPIAAGTSLILQSNDI